MSVTVERSEVAELIRTVTPEQREAFRILRDEAVTYALIKQRREICREVEQDVYCMWDSFIWTELQDKVPGWTPRSKHSRAHLAADSVRKIILQDKWLQV